MINLLYTLAMPWKNFKINCSTFIYKRRAQLLLLFFLMRTITPELGLELKIIQKDVFMLRSRNCRLIWKLIKYLVHILYGAIWTTSQYIMHTYWEKRCVLRHRFQRGMILIQKTTVLWSGASDHIPWNLQYQDWEHRWVYNKKNIPHVVVACLSA